ncbi:MAE_28990/MAE_18760 family HEPN-like nuclease [Isoptericola sp. NPDC055881]
MDQIDADLAWRKLELASWSSMLGRAKGAQRDVLVRGAWALLYAHWEGFVKSSCTHYVEFVDSQGLDIDDLRDCFVAIALRSHLAAAAASTHGSAHTQIVSAVRAGSLKANLPTDRVTIKTNANLKFETFEEILLSIGCDPADFDDLAGPLDTVLLKHRNDIAHGRYLLVSVGKWEHLKTLLVSAMDKLRTQIENRAATRAYRRS